MNRNWMWAALLALSTWSLPAWALQEKTEQDPAAQEPADPPEQPLEELWTVSSFDELDADAAAKKLDELTAEFERRSMEINRKLRQAKPEERAAMREQMPNPQKLVPLMQAIAEKYPETDAEFAGLFWVAQRNMGTPEFDAAFDTLLAHHGANPKLASLVTLISRQRPSPAIDARFQSILENPNAGKELRGVTAYTQLSYRKRLAGVRDMLNNPEQLAQIQASLGEEGVEYLKSIEPEPEEQLLAKLEKLASEYADVEVRPGKTLGAMLEAEIFEIKFLSIGKTAPDIDGEDIDGVAFKLSDYRGKVVVVDFWGDW